MEGFHLVRHAGHWLDLAEAVLIVGVLLAIGWLVWQAVAQAYTPVLHLVNQL